MNCNFSPGSAFAFTALDDVTGAALRRKTGRGRLTLSVISPGMHG